jgi:hypothetical protein
MRSGVRCFVLAVCTSAIFGPDSASGATPSTAPNQSNATQPSSNRDDDVISIDCEARIERRLDHDSEPFHFALIEAPPLEAARKYKLNIRLLNPTDQPIRFKAVSTDCGCSKFEVHSNEIPPLALCEFAMRIDVPNRIATNQVRLGASFSHVDPSVRKPALKLTVTYELTGSFPFASDRVTVEIPENQSLVVTKVPVIVVPPRSVDKLELQTTENLRDFSVKLVEADKESAFPYVEIAIPRGNVDREIMGEIILLRPGTNHATGVLVNIRHKESFSLRPESLRLTRDNRSKPYEATAILRVTQSGGVGAALKDEKTIDNTQAAVETREKSSVPPQLELLIANQPAQVQLQRLGESGVYRVTVRFDQPLEHRTDDTVELRWRVVLNGKEHVIKSHAFVL